MFGRSGAPLRSRGAAHTSEIAGLIFFFFNFILSHRAPNLLWSCRKLCLCFLSKRESLAVPQHLEIAVAMHAVRLLSEKSPPQQYLPPKHSTGAEPQHPLHWPKGRWRQMSSREIGTTGLASNAYCHRLRTASHRSSSESSQEQARAVSHVLIWTQSLSITAAGRDPMLCLAATQWHRSALFAKGNDVLRCSRSKATCFTKPSVTTDGRSGSSAHKPSHSCAVTRR